VPLSLNLRYSDQVSKNNIILQVGQTSFQFRFPCTEDRRLPARTPGCQRTSRGSSPVFGWHPAGLQLSLAGLWVGKAACTLSACIDKTHANRFANVNLVDNWMVQLCMEHMQQSVQLHAHASRCRHAYFKSPANHLQWCSLPGPCQGD